MIRHQQNLERLDSAYNHIMQAWAELSFVFKKEENKKDIKELEEWKKTLDELATRIREYQKGEKRQ